jgi:hypothetical protein
MYNKKLTIIAALVLNLITFNSKNLCANTLVVIGNNQQIQVHGKPSISAQINPAAGLTSTANVVWSKKGWNMTEVKSSPKVIRTTPLTISVYKNELALAPLFYPSPFRITDPQGSTLYIKFKSESDTDIGGDIELRIYDMRGNEIYRDQKAVGSITETMGFNATKLGHTNMPVGVYFYLLLHNGEVLRNSDGAIAGKGKFAIIP